MRLSKSGRGAYYRPEKRAVKLYIGKVSNLPVKIVEELQNGKIRITSYKYEFDTVTDKDVTAQGIRR